MVFIIALSLSLHINNIKDIYQDISKNPLENVKSRDKYKVIKREEETGIYLLC
jgi:hypothetical protein